MLFSPPSSTKISATPEGVLRHAPDEIDVDAFAGEVLKRPIAEVVCPERGDEHDGATRAHRRDRLVRPFAARCYLKTVTKNRFARRRDRGHPDRHIGVRAADDNDFAHSAPWSRRLRPKDSRFRRQWCAGIGL